jgi:uncharacterized protein with von Willebrand factor type A (vWA) domain
MTPARPPSRTRVPERVQELAQVLRAHEVRVGKSEVADALAALAALGADAFADRATFRATLQCTLVKSVVDVPAFDRAFGLCFDDAASSSTSSASSASSSASSSAQALSAVADALRGAAPPGLARELAEALLDGEEAGLRAVLRRGVDDLDLQGMQSPLQAGWYTGRLLARLSLDDLVAAARAALAGVDVDVADAARAAVDAADLAVRRAARQLIEREAQKRSGRGPLSPAERDLRTLDERQLEEARALMEKLAQRLRARILRRRKKSRRGRLDVRRTLRQSLHTDGVPVRVLRRRRRPEKPQLLLLCDVSDSVRASALFLLELCAVLADLFQKTQAYVFVDRAYDVTEALRRPRAQGGGAVAVVNDDRVAGGNSDYGRAFADVDLDAVTKHTLVVILGDGRSNYRDPRLDLVERLRERARRVVWLVPEERGTWGFGDSVLPRYARHADAMLPARTLRDLARAVDRLLR